MMRRATPSPSRRAARRSALGMFAELGPVLRLLRGERHRSQTEVALAAEIPRTTLSRYESGELVPSLGNLAKILTALDVPLARLAAELSPPVEPPRPAPAPELEPAIAAPEEEEDGVAPETLVVADLLLGGAHDLSPEAREVFTDLLDDVYHLARLIHRPEIPDS
jgi:transcriptional regulator with XRE-family HTH domain